MPSILSRLTSAVSGLSVVAVRWRHPRVPVLLQMNVIECGAACLAMILSYFGRESSVAECRASLGIGRNGISAQRIAEIARRSGLRVKAFKAEPSDLPSLQLPAIAHWSFNHFVVIER